MMKFFYVMALGDSVSRCHVSRSPADADRGRESREGGSWYAKSGGGSSEVEAVDRAFIWAPVAGHSSGFGEGIPQPPFVFFASERQPSTILRRKRLR